MDPEVKISAQYSKAVFDDALEAIQDRSHPCRHLVQWQKEHGYEPFQLPEPFSGRQANLRLAFIGLNPSASHDEVIPTVSGDWTFERYDDFYRSRFDGDHRDDDGKIFVNYINGESKKVRLWNNLEIFGNQFLHVLSGGAFELGRDAFLIEAVRYKTTKGWLGRNAGERRKVIEHQAKFTQRLVDEGLFSVLVSMGNDALAQMKHILTFSREPPDTIGAAEGRSFVGETPAGHKIVLCPLRHMSYPPNPEIKKKVARQIIEAVEGMGH